MGRTTRPAIAPLRRRTPTRWHGRRCYGTGWCTQDPAQRPWQPAWRGSAAWRRSAHSGPGGRSNTIRPPDERAERSNARRALRPRGRPTRMGSRPGQKRRRVGRVRLGSSRVLATPRSDSHRRCPGSQSRPPTPPWPARRPGRGAAAQPLPPPFADQARGKNRSPGR